ncbi:MAG: amidohydrolase [SAR202 cluster bacterium]|nr:amidohydrolase [SAR202 cluster bacterium]MDP6713250.1 amidohydrolase [SAR202 cluster bacterium]
MNITEPDLLFINCRVLTMDAQHPVAQSVAITGERITWVGSDDEAEGLASRAKRIINGQGQTLIPGFHDAHIHLLAYAASLQAVDCGPNAVSSIEDIKSAIAHRATSTPSSQWVRAVGYNDFDLREHRHPTRWDLDQAAPDNPVRLSHRSGHACVLNSLAMKLVGITDSTPEPPGGTIARDLVSGAPNGTLLEMDDFLDGKIPALTRDELTSGVAAASQRLASLGVTAIQDATPSNSVARWDIFKTLKAERVLSQRVTFMVGAGFATEFRQSGAGCDTQDLHLRPGAVKLMVTRSAGTLHPDAQEIRQIVGELDDQGFQVAIHAVESEAVSAAAEAIASATAPDSKQRHRIEHCSELPPDVLTQVVASGALVVTNPGFIYSSGRRYLEEVPEEDQPGLYRVGGLKRAGVMLGFGSDAPVIDPNPMLGIYSAVTRKSQRGSVVAPAEAVGLIDALEMHTFGSAFAGGLETQLGAIKPGHLADVVLLDRDITGVEPAQIAETQVTRTLIGGSTVWNAEES